MIMRRSLTTVAATALLSGAAGTAWAGDSHDTLPGADTALVQVFVNSEADVDKLSAKYDLAEYKQVEDDGTIQLNIDVDPQERAELRAMGFRIGQTIEDAKTRAAVNAERERRRGPGRARRRPGEEGRAERRHQARGQVGRADPG